MSLVLGINAAYHETCAALVRDGRVVFAVEEERLTRKKHGKSASIDNPDELPWAAIRACLDHAKIQPRDLDAIGYSLVPGLRAKTSGDGDASVGFGTVEGERTFDAKVRSVPRLIAKHLETPELERRVTFVPHHVAHAASAFYPSPFERAAVLVVDGIGEDATAWLGRGEGARLEALEAVPYPDSIGLLWERVAVWCGFTEYDAAKVMGLAAYGDPGRHRSELERLITLDDTGTFHVDATRARFRRADVRGLEDLFGPARRPDEAPESARFANVAAALQRRSEEALLALAGKLHELTGLSKLAYSGGVALNCVANARLEREGPFDELHVPAAAHDAGTAIGAALELAHRGGAARVRESTPFLGPAFDTRAVDEALARANVSATRVADPAALAADLVAQGRIVGWFQGALELGPRALGHRSLLADPRRASSREELNRRIKHREAYRPFAASVLAEHAREWFELPDRRGGASSRDLMLLTYRAKRPGEIPAVLHRDASCRIQVVARERDPLYHRLLERLYTQTGVPLVLNTSFNDREPIVCSPDDALATFRAAGLDDLILGDRHARRPAP